MDFDQGLNNAVKKLREALGDDAEKQPTVERLLTSSQIENVPINGRNVLDLAQLEPRIQILDAPNFGEGKDGFSSISFGVRFDRTARIEVDGVHVSEEILGPHNHERPSKRHSGVSAQPIQHGPFHRADHVGRCNVTTRSESDDIHGEPFSFFRDSLLVSARWLGMQSRHIS